MITKAIRGAIVVKENSVENLKEATIRLLNEIVLKNNLNIDLISHVIFSTTPDLDVEFPAKFARIDLNWKDVPMMCFHEMDVPNSLKRCLRVMIVINCDESFRPNFVYLDGAEFLRR